MKNTLEVVVYICIFLFLGCGNNNMIRIDDPMLAKYNNAFKLDREKLGFTKISKDSMVRIEITGGGTYDVMLHIAESDRVQRTIALKKYGNEYLWIHEQEIIYSSKKYKSVEGELKESLIITYEKEKVSGSVLNETYFHYFGDDARFKDCLIDKAKAEKVLLEWGIY